MYNHIVLEPAWKVREIARNALRGHWQKMFVALVIYYLLTGGVGAMLSYMFNFDASQVSENIAILSTSRANMRIAYGDSLYDFLVGGPFVLGLSIFLLTFFRAKQVNNSLIFDGFGQFAKAFLLQLLIWVKVFLWSLLFVIPGIVAYYRYSQAFFILADHPEYSVGKCIEESKRLMQGNKGKLFFLELSFIGWALLASIPSGIIWALLPNIGFAGVIAGIVAAMPALVLNVYFYTAQTAFYELLTERLVVSFSGGPAGNTVETTYTIYEQAPEEQGENSKMPGMSEAPSEPGANKEE